MECRGMMEAVGVIQAEDGLVSKLIPHGKQKNGALTKKPKRGKKKRARDEDAGRGEEERMVVNENGMVVEEEGMPEASDEDAVERKAVMETKVNVVVEGGWNPPSKWSGAERAAAEVQPVREAAAEVRAAARGQCR